MSNARQTEHSAEQQEGTAGTTDQGTRTNLAQSAIEMYRQLRRAASVAVTGLGTGDSRVTEQRSQMSRAHGSDSVVAVREKFRETLEDLRSDKYSVRQSAHDELRRTATFKELVDISQNCNLNTDQRFHIDKLLRAGARDIWRKFEKDPLNNRPPSGDASANEVLFKFMNPNWRDAQEDSLALLRMSEMLDGSREDDVLHNPLPSSKQLNEIVRSCEEISAQRSWLREVAKQPGAKEELKEFVRSTPSRDDEMAQVILLQAHQALSEANPTMISDAANISEDDKQVHGRAARKLFLQQVNDPQNQLEKPVLNQYLKNYRPDESVSVAEFADTTKKLIDNLTADTGFLLTPIHLLIDSRPQIGQLLDARGLADPKAKVVNEEAARLCNNWERQVEAIEEPQLRVHFQRHLADAYSAGNQAERARKMYERVRETTKLLSKAR